MNSHINIAKEVFDLEIQALYDLRDTLDDSFIAIINAIMNCRGKIVVTGMGKCSHIGHKWAATLSSLGTPSFFLHPAEALHGDLGMVEKDDIVIALSNSGESEEIVRLLPNIKIIAADLIAITSNTDSTLASFADYRFILPNLIEACHMDLAPTSSTTAMLVLGDALAIVLSRLRNFQKDTYALYHPGGSLGKRLLVKTRDLMHSGKDNAVVHSGTPLKDAILEMSSKALSMVNIIQGEGRLIGIITDGDLRRFLERGYNVYDYVVDDVMTRDPITIDADILAVDCISCFKNSKRVITTLPVINNEGYLVGSIRVLDIINAGIVL